MTILTSTRLKESIGNIMNIWEQRALIEIHAAHHQKTLALRNAILEYLSHLVNDLSNSLERTDKQRKWDKDECTRIGKKHGMERATCFNYTMDQLILEYHILRQVICEVLEKEAILTSTEREVIVCSIEQSVNDAATQFSDSLKDLQEELSHTLAHDLRNPIAIAMASVELILKQPDRKKCVDNANRISKSLIRLDKMIRDLLDVSRMRAGQGLSLKFKNCNLDKIIKEFVVESNLDHKNRFILQSSGECIGCWNEDGLRRLVENLGTNAVKFGLESAPVNFSLIQDEKTATLRIHNEGEPIPLDEQSSLFQKFRRAKSAEDKSGWGLGLTVVKGMVDAHHGAINIESKKGKGTTFIIKLPKVHDISAAEDSLTGISSTFYTQPENHIHRQS